MHLIRVAHNFRDPRIHAKFPNWVLLQIDSAARPDFPMIYTFLVYILPETRTYTRKRYQQRLHSIKVGNDVRSKSSVSSKCIFVYNKDLIATSSFRCMLTEYLTFVLKHFCRPNKNFTSTDYHLSTITKYRTY